MHVDWNASGTNSGTAANPWTSLQTALTGTNAAEGDTIFIAQGTYKPTTGTDRSVSFVISTKNLKLIGGYINNGGGSWSFSPATATTILSGNINNTGIATDNSFTVLKLSYNLATNAGTVISYLTIRDGYNGGTGSNGEGGGVKITAGASPRFDNVIVRENRAKVAGSGVYVGAASPVFTRCRIEFNEAVEPPSGEGGGIYMTGAGTTRLFNTFIFANGGVGRGGGLAAVHAEVQSGTTQLEMVNCVVASNSTGACSDGCPVRYAGGVLITGNTTTVPLATLTNCTIFGNYADHHAGGIFFARPPADTTTPRSRLRNCIVWAIIATFSTPWEILTTSNSLWADYCDIRGLGDSGYVVGNLVEPNTTNTNISDDPLLSAEYRPECAIICCDSPALEAGNPDVSIVPVDSFDLNANSYTSTEPTPDMDLNLRVVGRIDIGAFESPLVTTCVADIAPVPCRDGDVNVNDLLAIINSWGVCPAAPAVCPADITSDQTVSVNDLLAVINAWGSCLGSGTGAPQSVEDCHDFCDAEAGENEEKYWPAFTTAFLHCVNWECSKIAGSELHGD